MLKKSLSKAVSPPPCLWWSFLTLLIQILTRMNSWKTCGSRMSTSSDSLSRYARKLNRAKWCRSRTLETTASTHITEIKFKAISNTRRAHLTEFRWFPKTTTAPGISLALAVGSIARQVSPRPTYLNQCSILSRIYLRCVSMIKKSWPIKEEKTHHWTLLLCKPQWAWTSQV